MCLLTFYAQHILEVSPYLSNGFTMDQEFVLSLPAGDVFSPYPSNYVFNMS